MGKINFKMDDVVSTLEETSRTRELNLSHRGLPAAPDYVFTIRNLSRLDLSHNCLTAVPEQLGNLVNLRELWLSHNAIDELPQSIGNLKKLKIAKRLFKKGEGRILIMELKK